MIESGTNAQYKKIQKLMKQSRARRQEGVFVVEGWKMVKEALERRLVLHLYISEREEKRYREEIAPLCGRDVLTDWMRDSLFEQLSDTVSPQGILGIVKMPAYEREKIVNASEVRLLCLENIQDPGNLGTMFRTAEGAGMTGVLLNKGCVDLFNPKVVRSTMGALFRMPFYQCNDLKKEMRCLQAAGIRFYAAHLQGMEDYTEKEYKNNLGILIGNEANGLSEEVSGQADCLVKIPMEGELESLNAAVSAALLMYEVKRKRK